MRDKGNIPHWATGGGLHGQRPEDGGPERYVETGWAVIDRNGKVWTDAIFPSEDAATKSAEACIEKPWNVEKARRVSWFARKPGNKDQSYHETLIVGEDAHD